MRHDHAMHGGRFLVYAVTGGLVAAIALWASLAHAEARTAAVRMPLAGAATCARFRAAGAPVAGVAPCTVVLGRVREHCEGDPDCTDPASVRSWVYRPAKWLQARWEATATPVPMATPRPSCPPGWQTGIAWGTGAVVCCPPGSVVVSGGCKVEPSATPKPSATEADACPGGCMVYDFEARRATCRKPCPK
jgi:hypothetical protein